MKSPVMEPEDIIANLKAERDSLAERLRGTPEMREVVGELRRIHEILTRTDAHWAR